MTEDKTQKKICSPLMAACMVAAAAGFTVMLCIVLSGRGSGFDDAVRHAFYSIRAGWLTPLVKALTYMGSYQFIIGLCILLLVIRSTRIRFGVPVSAGALSVTIVNKLIKHAVARPRPGDIIHLVTEGGMSFPSGHSITSMFVYGILICQVRRYVKDRRKANALTVLLAVPMLLIGPSRIYLGVHYPTDVLAGWFLGIIALNICVMVMRTIAVRSRRSRMEI